MPRPLIMTAFGTSSKAFTTYDHLEEKITHRFGERQLHWTYSSRTIVKKLNLQDSSSLQHPKELLENLVSSGVRDIILQSLHLFPGKEFHSLCQLVHQYDLNCNIGLPLLTDPCDYLEFAEILRPLIEASKASDILILGHGTDHPIWVAYHCLEKILNQVLDKKVYVGVVEKFPDSSNLLHQICADKVQHLCIVPLFLVTGMHFQRDIIGENAASWRSRLLAKNIEIDIIDIGLGLMPGIERLICRHIEEAMAK